MNKTLINFLAGYLLLFVLASLFTYPAWDDFATSVYVITKGFWGSQVWLYYQWTGRFTPMFLMSLLPWMLRSATWAYQLISTLMILGFFLTSSFALRTFFPERKLSEIYPWAMLFTAFYSVSAYSIVQAWYWYTATITYTLSILFTSLAIGVLKKQLAKVTWPGQILLFFLATVINGSNEITVFLWNLLLLSVIAFHLLRKKPVPIFLWALFGFSIMVGLFVVLAPGNFYRASQFEKSGRVGRTVGNGFLHVPLYSIKFLSFPIIVTLLAYYQEMIEFVRPYFTGVDEKKQKYFLGAIWFALFFVTTAMSFWAQGRRPVSRALNVIQYHYFIFLPFAVYFLSLVFKNRNYAWVQKTRVFVRRNFTVLLIVSFLPHENTWRLVQDYSGPFWEWKKAWDGRLHTLQNSKGKDIVLEHGTFKPYTTGFKDLRGVSIEHMRLIYGTRSLSIRGEPLPVDY
ncbi:MAG TPA: hypothetical protein VNJ01_01550 [Bacteriovoracaceae bacterium]|nr:hypothetical protein [Bacteriovoracaceae bacterium]